MLINQFKITLATDAQRAAVVNALRAERDALAAEGLSCLFFNRDAILRTGIIADALTAEALWTDLIHDKTMVAAKAGYELAGASAPAAPALRVMAVRLREDGTRWQNEWMRGITSPAEANRVIGSMLGQDGIVDGYWLREDEEPYPLNQDARTDAQRQADFAAAMAVRSPTLCW